ncbi:MAG: hypothetical protein ABWZ27_08375 [Aestuariivirgaceae bacterium]
MTRLKNSRPQKKTGDSPAPKQDRRDSGRAFGAKPVKGPVDHEKLRNKTMTRFAKTIARLAK